MDHVDVPGQIALDIDALIREAELDAAPAWTGGPLRLTLDYRTPDEHAAAMQRWILEHGQGGCRSRSHMWSPAICHQPITIEGHELHACPSTCGPSTATKAPARCSTRPTASPAAGTRSPPARTRPWRPCTTTPCPTGATCP